MTSSQSPPPPQRGPLGALGSHGGHPLRHPLQSRAEERRRHLPHRTRLPAGSRRRCPGAPHLPMPSVSKHAPSPLPQDRRFADLAAKFGPLWTHKPSLVQHTGRESTSGGPGTRRRILIRSGECHSRDAREQDHHPGRNGLRKMAAGFCLGSRGFSLFVGLTKGREFGLKRWLAVVTAMFAAPSNVVGRHSSGSMGEALRWTGMILAFITGFWIILNWNRR